MNKRVLLGIAAAAILAGCQSKSNAGNESEQEKPVEIFSESKPLSLEIKRERSFYQAEKIARRLNGMGVEAYIISETESDGTWYKVTSGAFTSQDSLNGYAARLDSLFGIKANKTIDYATLDSVSRQPVKSITTEKNRIAANTPDVPQEIIDVIKKFPQNDMFYIKNIGMLCLNNAGIKSCEGRTIDMPRGVTLSYLKKKGCKSIASVIYTDNIFGDNVTLQVIRGAGKKHEIIKASFVPLPTPQSLEADLICSEIADMILATGNYQNEIKTPVKVESYTTLSGYKVSFLTKNGNRSYYILTDQAVEYIYIAQSTRRGDDEMLDFLAEVGRSEGLVMYDEFYNTFYTVSDEQASSDEFVGYYMEKLGWSYAKEKGYQVWAKKMVGHWLSALVFDNPSKGKWSYEIFDLLTNGKRNGIYNTLYMKDTDRDSRRNIYGVQGKAVYDFDWWTSSTRLTEINFGYGRYVVALTGSSSYSERDLILRAENLQFELGGYTPAPAELETNTEVQKETSTENYDI